MLRNTLNKIFSSRVFYILFSVLVAFVMWIYVEINENETLPSYRITEVPIIFLNEDLLRERDFIISSMSPQAVALTFIDCPRALRNQLNNGTVAVRVDLADVTSTGYQLLPFEISLPVGITRAAFTDISRSVANIQFNIDKLSGRPIPVEARYTGGAAENYIAGDAELNPSTIMIDGPESVIHQISRVWVPIERSNLSTTLMEDFTFVLLDENGDELDEALRDMLTLSQDTIRVTIPVSMIKEVALRVDIVDGAGATQQNTLVNIDPMVITVSGDPDDLMDFNTLTLATIDLSRIEFSHIDMYAIGLPNGIISHSGQTQALVEIEIIGLEMLILSVPNPRVVNIPADHSVTVITQTHDVRIRGRAEDLYNERLNAANVRVVADLTDIGPGMHTIPARVYLDGDVGNVGVIGNYRITVWITSDP